MTQFPQYTDSAQKGVKAVDILRSYFETTKWYFRELSGLDFGTDIELQLIKEGQVRGPFIKGQVKGTTHLSRLKNGQISFAIETKTINYGLDMHTPFVIFLVDLSTKDAYYIEIHEYYKDHPELKINQKTITLHFDKKVAGNEDDLRNIAIGHFQAVPDQSSRDAKLYMEFVSDYEDLIQYILKNDPTSARDIDVEVFNRIDELKDVWSDTAHMFTKQEYQELLSRLQSDLRTYSSLFNPQYFRTISRTEKTFIILQLNSAEAHAFLTKEFRPKMDKVRRAIGEAYEELKKMFLEVVE